MNKFKMELWYRHSTDLGNGKRMLHYVWHIATSENKTCSVVYRDIERPKTTEIRQLFQERSRRGELKGDEVYWTKNK